MTTLDPDVWKDCPKCGGAGKVPGAFGQATCAKCDGRGVVPRHNDKDPTWGPTL